MLELLKEEMQLNEVEWKELYYAQWNLCLCEIFYTGLDCTVHSIAKEKKKGIRNHQRHKSSFT